MSIMRGENSTRLKFYAVEEITQYRNIWIMSASRTFFIFSRVIVLYTVLS